MEFLFKIIIAIAIIVVVVAFFGSLIYLFFGKHLKPSTNDC